MRRSSSARELAELHRTFGQRTRFREEFFAAYKGLVFQIRAEGISAVRPARREAPQALRGERVPRRPDATPDASDFFILKHIWNNEDQAAILDSHHHPRARGALPRPPAGAARGDDRASASRRSRAEIDRVRQVLTGGGGLSDVQLFSQLKALNEIKTALVSSPDPRAPELRQRVDQLLEATFRGGRFAQL